MSAPEASLVSEPITPRGVVALAYGSVVRLWIFQLLTAAVVAVSVLWFFNDSCVPTVEKAIRSLSGLGEIRSGELTWNGNDQAVLAEERFLAFDVDLNHTGQIHCTSDVQIEFGRDSIRFFSLLGFADLSYPWLPPAQTIPVSREDLEPLWGAWLVEIQAVIVTVILVVFLLLWNVLATVYWLPLWIVGFFARRELGLWQSWRLAGAAQLPAGLLLALGIFLYDFGLLNLIQFSLVACAHLLLPWIYLVAALFFVPRHEAKPQANNPFEAEK